MEIGGQQVLLPGTFGRFGYHGDAMDTVDFKADTKYYGHPRKPALCAYRYNDDAWMDTYSSVRAQVLSIMTYWRYLSMRTLQRKTYLTGDQ
jgi:hypothetical protein